MDPEKELTEKKETHSQIVPLCHHPKLNASSYMGVFKISPKHRACPGSTSSPDFHGFWICFQQCNCLSCPWIDYCWRLTVVSCPHKTPLDRTQPPPRRFSAKMMPFLVRGCSSIYQKPCQATSIGLCSEPKAGRFWRETEILNEGVLF